MSVNSTLIPNLSNDVDLAEIIVPSISLFLFLLYLCTFYTLFFFRPMMTNLGLKMLVRRRWARQIVFENDTILAVQTLRNTVTAAGVFASAAVVVSFFAFNQGQTLVGDNMTLPGIKFYGNSHLKLIYLTRCQEFRF